MLKVASADATDRQRRQIERLAGRQFDAAAAEKAAAKATAEATRDRNRAMARGRQLIESLATPTEQHAAGLRDINELLRVGAIGTETYSRALGELTTELLESDEAFLRVRDVMQSIGEIGGSAFDDLVIAGSSLDDVLGRLSKSFLQLGSDMLLKKPAEDFINQIAPIVFGAMGGGTAGAGVPAALPFDTINAGVFRGGGIVGRGGTRAAVPESVFMGSPRLAAGGIVGDGVPAILHGNEAVIPLQGGAVPVRIQGGRGRGTTVVMNNTFNVGGGGGGAGDADTRTGRQMAQDIVDMLQSELS